MRRLGEHRTAAEMEAVLPDGGEFRMRDTTDVSDPAEAAVRAAVWDGDTWRVSDPVRWVHVPAGETACRF